MKKLNQIILSLFLVCQPLAADSVIKILDNHGHSSQGNIVKDNGKFYAYTAQSALFGVDTLQIKYPNGVIKKAEDYQISFNSDVARIPLEGDFSDFYTIGEGSKINDQVAYVSSDTMGKVKTEITAVGIRIFKIKDDFKQQSAGSPVLNAENKIIGILSSWLPSVLIQSASPFLHYQEINPKIVSRLDKQIKWLSAKKTNFEAYGAILKDSRDLQKEFLPIIQWWYDDPYRKVPDGMDYSDKMKTWVKYNNWINKIVDKLVAKVAEDPQKHKSLMKSLKESTIHRTELLYAFPSSKHQSLQIKWPTDYLQNEAQIHIKSWGNILEVMDIRKMNLEFVMPHEIKAIKEVADDYD